MPRKAQRIRVERGLYRAGQTYIVCATPPGSRSPRWKTLGEIGLMEARRERDAFAVRVRAGEVLNVNAKASFRDVAERWIEYQTALKDAGELAPRTLDAYATAVKTHLVPYFGSRQLRSVRPEDLIAWHAEQRAKGAAAWSIKGRWTALGGILGFAVRNRIIAANPADLLSRRERPKSGNSRQRFLTDAEMSKLLKSCRGRYRPLVAVGLFGGLRIAEALGLTWRDVDFAAGVLRVRYQLDRKGKRVKLKSAAARRDVVLMPALAKTLRRVKVASHPSRDHDSVFITGTGTSISIRNATRAFLKAVKQAKLDGITQHTLRHTFASILIAQGRDPLFVADQLGHSCPTTTLRTYAHLFRAAKQAQEAREELEAEYGGML